MSHEQQNISDVDTAPAPRYLTLGINMTGLRCLVVGGGKIGSRKTATLVAAGAEVTVLAPVISDEVQRLVAARRVEWQQAEYASANLDGVVLVVAATDDRLLNLRIAADAEGRGILACNVSAANHSRVVFPAVFTDEEIAVAVHSHGRQCSLSKQLRDEIAQWLKHRRIEQ